MGKDSNDEQVASMKEAFFLFSMDDDGKIAILELGILMRSLSRNPAQAQLKDNITLENLRSTFDFPRFLELMKKHLKNKPSNCQLCDAFKVFDKESISFISVSHLGRIVTTIM